MLPDRSARLTPYKIFIVEDHLVMREAYAAILEVTPRLELCGSAASAEEVLADIAVLACDLVVTDFRLPGLSGGDLIRRVHAVCPDLPVVVVSAHDDAAFVRECRDAGAAAVIGKRNLFETFVPELLAILGEPRPDAA